jgi:hypothetical protein
MKRSKIDFFTTISGTVYVNKEHLIKVIKDMKRITKKQLLDELNKCERIE